MTTVDVDRGYAEFLRSKATVAAVDGFPVDVDEIHPPLGWNERPSREWLEHAYVVRERGCPDIGRELGRDASTIRLWLVEAGITTRKREGACGQAFYRSPEWKAACVAVWHRADACCERCWLAHNPVRHEQTFHVHHVVSFQVRELRAVVENLRLLCPACHRWVHSRANVERELLGDRP